MAWRVVESLHGVGDIYAGDMLIRSTAYRVDVLRDDADAGAALKFEGHIDITGIGEAVVLAGPNDLTLRMEDGRRLHFALLDTGGSITGTTGLEAGLR